MIDRLFCLIFSQKYIIYAWYRLKQKQILANIKGEEHEISNGTTLQEHHKNVVEG
jgi:hypothetical protein